MLQQVLKAAGDWGWMLAVVAVVLALGFAAWVWNPVKEAEIQVSATLSEGFCPSGWSDESERDGDTRVYVCKRGNWYVSLNPDKSFSHARQDGVGGFVFDEKEVPGWPAD